MPLRIAVLPLAKSDIQSAADWYESQKPGLGKKVKDHIVKAIEQIADPLRGYGPVYRNLSRIFVEQFPYSIYFMIDDTRQRIVIYAVLHQKQDREEVLKNRGS